MKTAPRRDVTVTSPVELLLKEEVLPQMSHEVMRVCVFGYRGFNSQASRDAIQMCTHSGPQPSNLRAPDNAAGVINHE